jgi:glycosyltransferase involved in cell wall biosynthesis
MRVLYVLRTLDPEWGGPVEGVRRMSQALIALTNGATSIEIACSDSPNTTWHSDWNSPVHALGAGKFGMYGYNAGLARWLRSEVKRFDVVVVSGIWMYHSFATSAAASKAGVPYLIYVHGALDPWFKKYYPVKHLKKTLYWKLVEGRVFQDAARVVFTTEEERVLAKNAFHPYRCEEQVISYGTAQPPHPIERMLERQFRQAVPELRDDQYLLYLGRIHEKKGIDLLIKAFSEEGLLEKTHLVIAGPGETATATALRELANASPARERIHWTGPVYSEQKWGAIRGADALVLPSHCENFGISVAEALGCGVPVLISNKVNIWREVKASGAGLVDDDDRLGTARLLKSWASLPVDAKTAMRTAASRCFQQHYLIQRGAEELHRVLIDVISNSSKQRAQMPLAWRNN